MKLHRFFFLTIKGIYQPIKPFWDPPWPLTPPKKKRGWADESTKRTEMEIHNIISSPLHILLIAMCLHCHDALQMGCQANIVANVAQ